MKKEIKIKPFWYSDIWLFPKLITIITTLDKEGMSMLALILILCNMML